jgi:hypothetical protein
MRMRTRKETIPTACPVAAALLRIHFRNHQHTAAANRRTRHRPVCRHGHGRAGLSGSVASAWAGLTNSGGAGLGGHAAATWRFQRVERPRRPADQRRAESAGPGVPPRRAPTRADPGKRRRAGVEAARFSSAARGFTEGGYFSRTMMAVMLSQPSPCADAHTAHTNTSRSSSATRGDTDAAVKKNKICALQSSTGWYDLLHERWPMKQLQHRRH